MEDWNRQWYTLKLDKTWSLLNYQDILTMMDENIFTTDLNLLNTNYDFVKSRLQMHCKVQIAQYFIQLFVIFLNNYYFYNHFISFIFWIIDKCVFTVYITHLIGAEIMLMFFSNIPLWVAVRFCKPFQILKTVYIRGFQV